MNYKDIDTQTIALITSIINLVTVIYGFFNRRNKKMLSTINI